MTTSKIAVRAAARYRQVTALLVEKASGHYLHITSHSGDAIWKLPHEATPSSLKSLLDQYNSNKAWKARGSDGTAHIKTADEFISENRSIKDIIGESPDGLGGRDITMDEAVSILSGEIDGLTLLDEEGN